MTVLGATLADVVRTVVYVTNPSEITCISAAHRRAFGAAPPAAAVLSPAEARLGIEVTAVIAWT